MEPELDFSPLLLVSALALFIPLVSHRLTNGTIPSVVGEIVAGIIFGGSVVGVIEQNEWLEFLSLFGFAYLMFLSGLEINVAMLVRPIGPEWYRPRVALRQPMLSGAVILVLVVIATGLGVWIVNQLFPVDNFWMLTFILTASAVGVVVPVLKSRDDSGPFGQSILVVGFLLEFVAILGVGVAAALKREGLGVEFWLILAMPAAFAVLLWSTMQGRTRFPGAVALLHELAHASSQIQIRAALAVLVMFVVLSQVVGTELVLGAFLAGLALTILSPKHGSSMRVKLDAMGYGFFVPIFFITAGAAIDVDAIFAETDTLLLLPAFIAIAVAAKVIPVTLVLWAPYGLRRALAAGTVSSANLSLILAAGAIALELDLIDGATNGALLVVALVTTAIAPPLFNRILGPPSEEGATRAVLIGAGDTGGEIAPRLRAADLDVTAIDVDEAALRELAEIGCRTILGDAADPQVLGQADIEAAEVAVIALGDLERTVEVATALRNISTNLRIVTWVAESSPRLDALEVDTYWQKMANATALTAAVLRPGLFTALSDANAGLREVVMRNSDLDSVVLQNLGLPAGVRILLITRNGYAVVPEGDTGLELFDRLTLAGDHAAVEEARSMFVGAHAPQPRSLSPASDHDSESAASEDRADGIDQP
jgi:Kef-type K+ transport system membrane component KefB/Trk K+ transport system NAD-binding subunit